MAKGGMVIVGRGGGTGGPQLQNGRVNLQGYTLKNLIMLAWDLNGDNMLEGAPKWLDTDRFDVIAKVTSGPASDAFTDLDSIKPLRVLYCWTALRWRFTTKTDRWSGMC
jgi:uncharacterized protein (TIGR03435 family)